MAPRPPEPNQRRSRPGGPRALAGRLRRHLQAGADPRPLDVATLAAWAEEHLGPLTTVRERSWRGAKSIVVEVVAEDGRTAYAKQPHLADRYVRELAAYQQFLPALGDLAPQLLAAERRRRLLLVSGVDGRLAHQTPAAGDPAVHRSAGRWLRVLHGSLPPRPAPDARGVLAKRLAQVLERGSHLLSPDEVAFVRAEVDAFDLPGAAYVPCHLDFTPRNWVVGGGTVRAIDLGNAGLDLAVVDLARLARSDWVERPDLRDAFLEGYGPLAPRDHEALRRVTALSAAQAVVHANLRGSAALEARAHAALAHLRAGG